MTGKQKRILSITLASWGVIMVGSGMAMNASIHPIIKTSYSTAVNHIKVNESKTNEIILKQITIEINNPLSVDVKDYLENVEQLDNSTLKALKLDTSMVKINEAGIYTYTITLKKKKYNGTITVKEKALPNVSLKLKNINLEVGKALPIPNESNNYDFSFYVENELTDEMKANMTLDISKVNISVKNVYDYSITYNNTVYTGKITVYNPVPKTPIPTKHTCEVVDGRYYDKEGNTVSELEYNNSCQPTASQSPSPSPSPSPSEENKNLFPVLP